MGHYHSVLTWIYRLADAARHRARRKQWNIDLASGRRGEDLAHRLLRRRGCTIVARNHRPPTGGGEVDLIVWKDGMLVFVEVKSRASGEFGAPDRAVDAEKRQSLIRVARDYTRRARIDWTLVRFDIVSVILGHPPQVEWIPDAFSTNAVPLNRGPRSSSRP